MADPSSSAPKKRSLFKRPAWAQSTTADKADSPESATVSMFDRSATFDYTVAERDRRRREQSDKKKSRDEKRRSNETQRVQSSPDSRSGKRRRISDLDDDLPAATSNVTSLTAEDEVPTSQRHDAKPTAAERSTRATRTSKPTVIRLDGSDADDHLDDDTPMLQTTNHTKSFPEQPLGPEPVPEPDSESDPELAEIKRNARQKRRREEKEEEERANAPRAYDTYGSADQDNRSATPLDPTVQLFITSPIPNATPLIVSRKFSQRLQEVKEAWFGRQSFGSALSIADVFFTFRLRKLYDVTTCKSLGVRVDADGRFIPDERNWLDDDDTAMGGEHEGKVHLEAVTEELYLKLREAKRNERNGSSTFKARTERPHGEVSPMGAGDAADAEPVIKLSLKAIGYKDVKIKVKPSTTFSKLADGARRLLAKQAPIPEGRLLTLAFDGEALEPPEGMIKDTDIEDLDSLEVYIK